MAPEDHEAARLYDRFGPSLYRYALMVLANRESAEDVVQQVFVAFLDRKGAGIEDAERYLRRSVRNACYSALRHQKTRGSPVDETLLEATGAASPAPGVEERIALAVAIQQLPPDQREVLHLHVFEGYTFRDIAVFTGESLNTIASRYRYALEKLKGAMTRSKS